ncbi:cytochrome b562 [Gilvimarinus algae]|uniref:Cytochrome b562 n=1 Tax=Gilvimarinus algae TaxID=3058037 RepID=A0ABT8TJ20_9GAMM|nr:cytochrome b562 [Gilvimarinus sp. SDUM040014]MDO3383348.1 cytochrome b562 [Gilvimarinus sp. SDUM040014]
MKPFLAALLCALMLGACSKHDDLHESMETMGDAFKTMRESSDLDAVKTEWESFKAGVELAQMQQVAPEDQATFDKGMDELAERMAGVDAALAAGDLELAKQGMKRLGEVRKEYHDKLEVK